MRSRLVSGLAAIASAGLLAGCSTLPAAGPTAQQIDPPSVNKNAVKDYVLVDLSQQVVDILSQYRVAPFSKRFAAPRPAPGQVVGLGDQLSITLFEAGQGGLFASDYGARVTLNQRVDSDGSITVPYGGKIQAAGVSPQVVEKRIVAALEGRAIQPQALVQITETVSRSFVVNGEVGKSGRYPITGAGDKVLDALALAGGPRQEAFETRVTLQRGSAQGSAIMKDLIENPADNVYVQPNDRIYVTKDPEIFLAFGAVPNPGPIPFGLDKISLLEAVGKAGGLIDQRSDPAAFFLFRYEPASAVRSMRPDYDGHLGDKVPVVYRVNLRDPRAYFFAKAFVMRDRDVLYVANAQLTELQKFLEILASARNVASTAYTVQRIGAL
ncbi:polysaccharide biosynthesis/export family protein [Hansschlegelia sp.]|uniref:polysaccharide biosynthesis/export family protein n=1 Tax=Hansschlegelia sp. TaxID=2041892 RepID=UPI002C83F164|nr:polysaccharide biosynthesis/export family protein [Hansschlegelia sp.]HVI29445.1 polysaccharide biosynthesis/export family protein [Hansschlegelia sp.]